MNNGYFNHLKEDVPASVVVFFIAVPLCLGIAMASGAPLFAGIISGIVGGIVVGAASGSALGVSGPAAGLTAIILNLFTVFNNSWETILLVTLVAGIFQIIAGYMGGGIIAYYFPSSVIKGMLVGIGIIIILKQIPYALGLDQTFSETTIEGAHHLLELITELIQSTRLAPTFISLISVLMLIFWDNVLSSYFKICKIIPGPLVVVAFGVAVVWSTQHHFLYLVFNANELVKIPEMKNATDLINQLYFPDFSQLTNFKVYQSAAILALIASIETLLCVEATDKLDPQKRITPTDRELKAQGLGNIICGLIGGLPVTQVIVRSSANITFGGKTKLSCILHGCLILLCVMLIPSILNMIPLASLSAILFVVGYKLAHPKIMIYMYKLSWEQSVPFFATIIGIVAEDLLLGITIGMAIAIFIILRHNYKNSHETFHYMDQDDKRIHITLAEDVSYLNKGSIIREFRKMPKNVTVTIDCSKTKHIDYDVVEAIDDFVKNASNKNIKVEYIGRALV
jgi:MFS superfamily sulfate permease-like transporter